MLIVIEGANYVGKTSTLEELKNSKPEWMFAYHPRFNDSKNYYFKYSQKMRSLPELAFNNLTIHVPRDVIYQISHMTCLTYLKTMHENHTIILDRCFLSEMVYNELHDKQIYRSFIDILKGFNNYILFYLSVDSDEELKKRITNRLASDQQKSFGIRMEGVPSGECVVNNDIVQDRFDMQRALDKRYKLEIECSGLNTQFIDTSNIVQKEVANKVIEESSKIEEKLHEQSNKM